MKAGSSGAGKCAYQHDKPSSFQIRPVDHDTDRAQIQRVRNRFSGRWKIMAYDYSATSAACLGD